MRATSYVLALGLLGAGCSWSAFDDLADQTWVDSVGAAEGISPNDFLGVAAPGVTDATATFVVLGANTDSVGSYSYDADGVVATAGVEIRANSTQFGVLDPRTPIAGDPYSGNVGVAGATNDNATGNTKIIHFPPGSTTVSLQSDFNSTQGPLYERIWPTGLVYARTDDDGAGTTTTDAVIARGPQVAMAADYATSGGTLSGCVLETAEDLVLSVGAANFDPADADDEVIAVFNDATGASGIVILDGSAIASSYANRPIADQVPQCRTAPTGTVWTTINGPAGDTDFGRAIVVGDFDGDGDPDWAVSSPMSNRVIAYINEGNAGADVTEIEVPVVFEASQFGASMAAGDLDGDGADELIVGAPRADVEGATNAGTAHIYAFDGAAFSLTVTLHDAQPETEQGFGTAVAVVPWGDDRRVLVVVGDTEVFTYFRTQLYDDVRNGQ